MKSLRELIFLSDPGALAVELQDRYVSWNCPRCGRELAQRKEFPVLERRCQDCLTRLALKQTSIARSADRMTALEECGVPLRFRQLFQDRDWPAPLRVDAISKDWTGDPWAVGFLGESGSGKTFLATELFWRRLPHARTAAWYRADALVSDLFGSKGEEAQRKALEVQSYDLLLLDDIGWGTKGGGMEKLFGVIANRHAEMLSTIWTSNTKWAELVGTTTTGQAFARRLEDGWRVPVKGDWSATKGKPS